MTNILGELASEVRILELEERKLELEKHITQLKAEQLIDGCCVGCAGPCMVVDVSANLQKELDHIEITALKTELSARKEDSAVLKKVVLVLKTWNECHRTDRSALDQLSNIVKDYLDAPGEPPETPIDESQNVAVVFTHGPIL